MPATIGSGRAKRTASISASSCVLSPISATATATIESRKTDTGAHAGQAAADQWPARLPPDPGDDAPPKVSPDLATAGAMVSRPSLLTPARLNAPAATPQ